MLVNLARLILEGLTSTIAWFLGLSAVVATIALFGFSDIFTISGWPGLVALVLISFVFGLLTSLAKSISSKQKTDTLIVFSTPRQKTELRATSKGLILSIYGYKPRQKELAPEELMRILDRDDIFIRDSELPERGLFDMGSRKEWYYSKHLFPEHKQLHDALRNIAYRAIGLSKKSDRRAKRDT